MKKSNNAAIPIRKVVKPSPNAARNAPASESEKYTSLRAHKPPITAMTPMAVMGTVQMNDGHPRVSCRDQSPPRPLDMTKKPAMIVSQPPMTIVMSFFGLSVNVVVGMAAHSASSATGVDIHGYYVASSTLRCCSSPLPEADLACARTKTQIIAPEYGIHKGKEVV